MVIAETYLQKEKKQINNSIAVIILNKYKNIKILDYTITEWLQNELRRFDVYVIDNKNNQSLKDKIGVYCKNYEYFIIIYNNTPFITADLILKLLEYVTIKSSKACKLFSGAIYNSKYYFTAQELVYDNFYMQDQDCFANVETEDEIIRAEKKLSIRVIDKLKRQGVIISNPNSLVVSPLCIIGSGTTIMNNCVIKGKSEIGKNVVINNNTTLTDSKIGDKASVSNSIITKSKIGNNTIISPYCNINKANIDKDCVVGYYCVVDNYKIKKGTNVLDRTTLRKEK